MPHDMTTFLDTRNFIKDDEKQSLFGLLSVHDWTLLGHRFFSQDYPNIEGGVYQFGHTSRHQINIDVPIPEEGAYFGVIYIDKGWETIKENNSILFELIPNEKVPNNSFDVDRPSKPNEIRVKLRRMNKPHELSSFFIDVRGGSTDGAGRNEHGEAHFHLLKKNTFEDFGKVDIPSVDSWRATKNKMDLIKISGGPISKAEKKELVNWLDKENNINLCRLHDEWTLMNKYNNRTPGTTA